MRIAAAGLAVALAVSACSTGPDQAEVVATAAEGALIPAMDEAAVSASRLSDAVATYCAVPGQVPPDDARAAWAEAKAAWERSELTTFFGPADMLRTLSKVDYAPISQAGIDELLSSDTTIDVDFVDNKAAATQRGLGAIEYGLFGDFENGDAERVCELIKSAADVVTTETRALHAAWVESFRESGPWLETFTGTMTPNQGLGDIVGAIVETLKRQSLLELGKGLGISAQHPEPEMVPEGASGEGASHYRAQLEGIRAVLETGGESSLLTLIRSRDETVADGIEALLGQAESELSSVEGSLLTAMEERPEQIEGIYQALADLRTLFEADVVSLLDITLGFSDTDGDSG